MRFPQRLATSPSREREHHRKATASFEPDAAREAEAVRGERARAARRIARHPCLVLEQPATRRREQQAREHGVAGMVAAHGVADRLRIAPPTLVAKAQA